MFLLIIKKIHILCALLSIAGFVLRGVWMWRESAWLRNTWTRVLPHVVDTVLLVSAIILAIGIRQYPGTHSWLTAKVVGLVVYIVLGSIALKYGKTKTVRLTAWLAALAVFGYIVAVAISHDPLPLLIYRIDTA